MGDSSVIEVKESIYIFDCYGVGACYSVKVLSRAPYSVRNRSIKYSLNNHFKIKEFIEERPSIHLGVQVEQYACLCLLARGRGCVAHQPRNLQHYTLGCHEGC